MTGGRLRLFVLAVLFCAVGYAIAPFSYGDHRLLVPRNGELDAIQQTLLFADRTQTLLSNPRAYYDTAILYPDRNQLRALEPCLGFVLLGLPLHALQLDDVDVFEVLRWLMVVVPRRALPVRLPVALHGRRVVRSSPGASRACPGSERHWSCARRRPGSIARSAREWLGYRRA